MTTIIKYLLFYSVINLTKFDSSVFYRKRKDLQDSDKYIKLIY